MAKERSVIGFDVWLQEAKALWTAEKDPSNLAAAFRQQEFSPDIIVVADGTDELSLPDSPPIYARTYKRGRDFDKK